MYVECNVKVIYTQADVVVCCTVYSSLYHVFVYIME